MTNINGDNSMEYQVIWAIELDAASHEEAARLALGIQRDPDSAATCFAVINAEGACKHIDVGMEECLKN